MRQILLLLALGLPLWLGANPALDAKIKAAVDRGAKPVIFVDLDATLFSEAARVRLIMEAYDRTHQTQLFAGADWDKFTTFAGLEDAIAGQLKAKGLTAESFTAAKNDIMAFEFSRRFHAESIQHDRVYEPLKDAIGKWEAAGARVVFLTGRDQTTREATTKKLSTEGLGRFPLITKHERITTAQFKSDTIKAYREANPGTQPVALLDDAIENLQVVREAHPDLLTLRTTQKTPTSLELDAPLEPELFETVGRYAHNYAKWKYEFIPSRKKLHAEIVKKIAGNSSPTERPLILFTSGSFGSGKSTTIGKLVDLNILPATDFNWIDPDKIRELVPEYQKFRTLSPTNAGTLVHLEVGLIQELVFEQAAKNGQPIIMEGTLRSYEWNKSEFDRIRKLYPQYRIGILALKADEAIAEKRVHDRAKTEGREIPSAYIAQVAKDVPQTLKQLEPFADFTLEVVNNDLPTITRVRVGDNEQTLELPLTAETVGKNDPMLRKISRLLAPGFDGSPDCVKALGQSAQPPTP